MKAVWSLAKKYYELIAYVVLTVLLFCACFVPAIAWITTVYVIVLGALWHQENKLIGLMLYLNSFYALFNYHQVAGITLDIILAGFFILMLLGVYVYRVIKREQKVNWKTLIPIGLFFIYVILPFHQYTWRDFFTMVFFYAIMYVTFEQRKRVDFRYVVRVLVVGLIISCLFATMKNVSPLLSEKLHVWDYFGKYRFQGLVYHPNTLNRLIAVAFCGLLVLKYKNKISMAELLSSFIPLFIFGYLTISRSFIVTILTGIVIFTVFYFIHNKAKSLVLFSVFLSIMCIVGGMFFYDTKIYFQRFKEDPFESPAALRAYLFGGELLTSGLQDTFDNQTEWWKRGVLEGRIRFDPGRSGLNELYLRDWSASPKSIWLGYGISKPLIGQMSSHNLYIQELWKHGIVGYLFYLAIILTSINWKKLKKIKRYLPGLILFIPYLMFTVVEQCLYDYVEMMVVIFAFSFVSSLFEPKGAQDQVKLIDVDHDK